MYVHSVRNYCKDFLSQLIEAFDDTAVEAIIYVSEKFLQGSAEGTATSVNVEFEDVDVMKYIYKSPHEADEKKEVGLYLLGTVSDDIVKYRSRRSLDDFNMSIFERIMSAAGEKDEILIGRSLWCSTQLSEILPKHD